MSQFANALLAGLGVGSMYALVALGFSFIYRTTGSFNLAQGQLVTLGALFAYTTYMQLHLPLVIALVCTVAAVAIVGGVIAAVGVLPIAGHAEATSLWLISTLGMGVLISGVAERIWGSLPLGVNNYFGPSVIHFSSHIYAYFPYLLTIGCMLVIALFLEIFQRVTLWGKLLRAAADNRHALELAGISTQVMGLVSFAIGGALAGLAGFLLAPVTYAQASSGFGLVILAFAAFGIGGFGTHWGAVVGGLIIGVVENVGGLYLGLTYSDVLVLAALVAVLLLRPTGLLSLGAGRSV